MIISKKHLYSLIAILALVAFLPVVVFMLKGKFDIRPRAVLSGAVNFGLTADRTSVSPGETMNVLVSVTLTDQAIRASGVDFRLLFDSSKLNLVSVTPVTGNSFTDVVLLDDAGLPYSGENGTFNYLRLSMVSKKVKADLTGGTIALANVAFQAKQTGSAKIKFPDDNSLLQVVGTSL